MKAETTAKADQKPRQKPTRKDIKAVVDRVEGKIAVLEVEGRGEVIWPVGFLPKGIKPGNILNISITKDLAAEKKQREKIRKLQKKLMDH